MTVTSAHKPHNCQHWRAYYTCSTPMIDFLELTIPIWFNMTPLLSDYWWPKFFIWKWSHPSVCHSEKMTLTLTRPWTNVGLSAKISSYLWVFFKFSLSLKFSEKLNSKVETKSNAKEIEHPTVDTHWCQTGFKQTWRGSSNIGGNSGGKIRKVISFPNYISPICAVTFWEWTNLGSFALQAYVAHETKSYFPVFW